MNQNQPSAKLPVSTEDKEEQMRLFVSLLTVHVLIKCKAFKDRSQETWAAHTNQLIDKTMEGLRVPKGFYPELKHLRKVSNSVIGELKKLFCGRQSLEYVVVLQNPAVDATIVRTIQACIQNMAYQRRWTGVSSWWRQAKEAVSLFSGSISAFLSPLLHSL